MRNKLRNKIKKNKKTLIILAVLLFISGVAHGYNMFHYPYYENDEGVYMSQAWSLITQGRLAPYTYWYDHAPAGWMLIALWTKITGGFFTFGLSVNSGRVLMLLLHLGTTAFLFFITKKLTKSRVSAAVAVLFFSLSPLGIYFQRRVLLDNIMTFWLFMSLAFLFKDKLKLSHFVLSAISFGLAVLSKENAIFFAPIILYLIYQKSHAHHKDLALIKWLAISGFIISFYLLYALLKGELFPVGFLGDNTSHVSLLATLKEQLSRDSGASISDFSKNGFWNNMRTWLADDPVIILLGIVTTEANLLIGVKNKTARFVGLLSLSFWLFLIRGGIVIEFYIIPLLPIFALNIAIFGHWLTQGVGALMKRGRFVVLKYVPAFILGVVAVVTFFHFGRNLRQGQHLFLSDQTTPQKEAVEWMLSRETPNDFFVIDNYGYVDLHSKGKNSFNHAEWYWKVDRDPDIATALLNGSPQGIAYIALTPQMEHDITTFGLDITLAAWHNSKPVKIFWRDGWGVEFWATQYSARVLERTWESYKNHFIFSGKVIDPYQENLTTSEAQSYALLRAVWIDDQGTFDAVYRWTENNLQQAHGLFSWRWESSGDSGSIVDKGTATDADQDIALALLFAYKQWGQESYVEQAKKIINAMWQQEVVVVDGIPYLTAGNWANHEDTITVNPSYLSPATYRIFAEVDTQHLWLKLADSSYQVLQDCTGNPLDKEIGVLPPEWCALEKESGEIVQSTAPQPTASEYSYNAFRIPWRVALDYLWFEEPAAKKYLKTLSILSQEWEEKRLLSTSYQHDGVVWEAYESVSAYSGNLGYFIIVYPDMAQDIYNEKILGKFYEDGNQSYWEDPENYYAQNWAWFGTALYAGSLPNLWSR